MDRNLPHWLFRHRSDFWILNGRSFFSRMTIASTTLTACAMMVAMAAPAASILNPATKSRSPAMLIRQATSTNSKGDLLSPRPRKMAASILYATMKKIPMPQMRT